MKRLSRFGTYELVSIKDGTAKAVSERLLSASKGSYRIALDERGRMLSTRQFATLLDGCRLDRNLGSVSFLIGSSDGHTKELRERCDLVLSLSPLTMQHELALLVLTEQLYRLETIRVGSPYHRD